MCAEINIGINDCVGERRKQAYIESINNVVRNPYKFNCYGFLNSSNIVLSETPLGVPERTCKSCFGESEGNCALYATAWHPLAQFAERDGALETIVSENNDKKDIKGVY